ncbi:MAG: hypothetical protein ACR2JY_14930 [Chloroflexota bacterium]
MSNTPAFVRGAAAVALLLTLGLHAVPLANAESCQFILGFKTMHDLLGGIVGGCLDNEQHNPANGDGLQHTTRGLLVWRKADNHTAFTDGDHTWVNGPKGLEYRLNTVRFPWEPNPQGLTVVPDAYLGRAPSPLSGPQLRITDSTLGYVRGPLEFRVVSSGFSAGEAVTLRGTYVPLYSLATGNPQSPSHQVQCATITLGPVQVFADAAGAFTATIQAPNNLHTGGEAQITAAGERSGASAPATEVAPEGSRVSTIPAGCRDTSGATVG